MGNEMGMQMPPQRSDVSIEEYYQTERGCECGFCPFEKEDDFRKEMIALKGQIPSFDMNMNGQCECGFTPSIDSKSDEDYEMNWIVDSLKTNTNLGRTCTIQTALRNHNTFPAADTLMKWNICKTINGKKRHWCMILDIYRVTQDGDSTIIDACDLLNNEFRVYFDDHAGKTPSTFTWDQIKSGSTLAIMYPEVTRDENNDPEIHQTNLDRCFVFNTEMSMVKHEAHMMMEDANANCVSSKCFCCGISCEEVFSDQTQLMSRCSSCKLAKYCSKKCQTYAWKNSHKYLCKQSQMLLRLTGLPVIPFQNFLSFKSYDKATSLPEYKPNPNMKVKSKDEAKIPGVRRGCTGKGGNCRKDSSSDDDDSDDSEPMSKEEREKHLNMFMQQTMKEVMHLGAIVVPEEHETEPKKQKVSNNGSNKCGLCGGSSKKLKKTKCCGNWCCDDRDEYVSSTRSSCWMNHNRNSVCWHHYERKHGGKWQDCEKCKQEMSCHQYVQFATSRFSNFETVKDLPVHPMKCCRCDFWGSTLDDFCTDITVALNMGDGGGLFGSQGPMQFTCKIAECMRKSGIRAV